MSNTFITNSARQTQKLGVNLAKEILKTPPIKTAQILALQGNLGGGKTTFLQGFARGLGIKEKILSPTFVVFKRFKIQDARFKNFYHVDCYRINKPKEVLGLGFEEIISDPKNIVAIEWSEKLKKALLKNTLNIKFKFIDKNKREIIFNM